MAFAVSTIVGIAGLGLAGASAVMNYNAAKDNQHAQEAQLAANQEHANLVNASNLKVQADNVQALNAQQAVEGVNKDQMNLDATRKSRDIIRQGISARSQALVATTAAGATGSGSSALGGVDGGISGRTGVNLLGVTQNQDAGNAIFGFHQDQLNAYKQAAIDGYVPATAQVPNGSGTQAALASGLGTLGGVLGKSTDLFSRVGNYFGGSGGNNGSIGVGDYQMPTIGFGS